MRPVVAGVRKITRGADGTVDVAATMEKLKPPPPVGGTVGGFARVKSFISKNKQAIINTLGIYFVFAYAVHNYRVQVAWDAREEEFVALEDELERVKSGLNNDKWAKDTADKVAYARRGDRAGVLSTEIQKLVQWVPPTAEERVRAAKNAVSPLAQAAALIAQTAPATTAAKNPSSSNAEDDVSLKLV